MRLKEKVAIVTGAASGIGREIARLFAVEGAKVAIFDKNLEGGQETLSILMKSGGEGIAIGGDVVNVTDVENMVEETVRTFGQLDILVNNSGVLVVRDIIDLTFGEWDRVLDINLKGTFICSKLAVEQMVKQGRGGSIVNIASDLGVIGLRGCTAYCASKGGIVSFTRALALDGAKRGIRANCVCPSTIETPMLTDTFSEEAKESLLASLPIGRLGKPLDVALAALYMASDEASYVTGTILMCDGGKTCQ